MGPGAAAGVPALIDALKANDSNIRKLAATVLGEIGPAAKGAVKALIVALRDRDILVRQEVALALKQIDSETAKRAGIP